MKKKYLEQKKIIFSPKGFPFISLNNNWEARWVYHPQIVKEGNLFYMFYSGKSGYVMKHDIGLATSKDLKEWVRHEKKPILSPSSNPKKWDSDLVAHSYVIKNNKTFYMFYDGSPKKRWVEGIGVAKSKDLIHWEKIKVNPVLKAGDFWWDKDHVSRCCVVKARGGYFYMFYAGHDNICERIGVARSRDLIKWEKFIKEPVLHLGKKNEWDERHISDPRILKVGDFYLMFYTGYDAKAKGSTGLAFSQDLISWKKFVNNPVLEYGKKNEWTQDEAGRADFVKVGKRYYLFFSGRKKRFFSIGYVEIRMSDLMSSIREQENAR